MSGNGHLEDKPARTQEKSGGRNPLTQEAHEFLKSERYRNPGAASLKWEDLVRTANDLDRQIELKDLKLLLNPLTQEANEFFRSRGKAQADGSSEKAEKLRYPFRSYVDQDHLTMIAVRLGRQMNLDEVKSLVSDDGEPICCEAEDCSGEEGRESKLFQPVRSIKLNTSPIDPPSGSGELEQFTENLRLGDEVVRMERGSFFALPVRNGDQIVGWKTAGFCGAIFWWTPTRGVVPADPLKSCLQCHREAFDDEVLPALLKELPRDLGSFVGKPLSRQLCEKVVEAMNHSIVERESRRREDGQLRVTRRASAKRLLLGGSANDESAEVVNSRWTSSNSAAQANGGPEIAKAALAKLNGKHVVAKLPEA